MARPRNVVPSYRLHKQSGQAIVTVNLNGTRKDYLLGPTAALSLRRSTAGSWPRWRPGR